MPDSSTIWDLVHRCRDAIDQELYGGAAPSDSNALTEVRPTECGAAFVVETDEGKVAIMIAPLAEVGPVSRMRLVDPRW